MLTGRRQSGTQKYSLQSKGYYCDSFGTSHWCELWVLQIYSNIICHKLKRKEESVHKIALPQCWFDFKDANWSSSPHSPFLGLANTMVSLRSALCLLQHLPNNSVVRLENIAEYEISLSLLDLYLAQLTFKAQTITPLLGGRRRQCSGDIHYHEQ